jgi:hypothetical protein
MRVGKRKIGAPSDEDQRDQRQDKWKTSPQTQRGKQDFLTLHLKIRFSL